MRPDSSWPIDSLPLIPWTTFGHFGLAQEKWTSSLGFLTGRLRSMTASKTLKIAMFAPIPRASVRTTAVVNAGLLASVRTA